MNVLETKIDGILRSLASKEKAVVALSGGVDSSLVAILARRALGDGAVAVTAVSPTLPSGELEDARMVARRIGIEHMVIRLDELSDPNFAMNPVNRCYYCKKGLMKELKALGKRLGIETIVDGTNADDLKGHRPGVAALREEGAYSPLAEFGLTKEEVREASRRLGLPVAEKPSMACLSSRVAYGDPITHGKLSMIDRAEMVVKNRTGVKEVRVRMHGDLARIEVGRGERSLFFDDGLMDALHSELMRMGFAYVTLDLDGYRSGSMNEALGIKTKATRGNGRLATRPAPSQLPVVCPQP